MKIPATLWKLTASLVLLAWAPTAHAAADFSAYSESRAIVDRPFTGQVLPSQSITLSDDLNTTPETLIYDGPGVWDTGREHFKAFLTEHGHTYRTISAKEVLTGALRTSKSSLFYMPGGASWEYLKSLGGKGAQEIKDYITRGGAYMGICAGAFYATANREGGYKTGKYGIGLLDGTAYDGTALKKSPFKEGMLPFELFIHGLQSLFQIVLLGGPSFHYTDAEATSKQIEVLARFTEIEEPAMVFFQYGHGQVFLSGPHPEVEENRTDWGKDFNDPESDWPILENVYQRLTLPHSGVAAH